LKFCANFCRWSKEIIPHLMTHASLVLDSEPKWSSLSKNTLQHNPHEHFLMSIFARRLDSLRVAHMMQMLAKEMELGTTHH
jgi:hypothetical protein